MKTNEELKALKEEIEAVDKKLDEITDDETTQVSGGTSNLSEMWTCIYCNTLTMQTCTGFVMYLDDDGNTGKCWRWVCENCERNNYFDIFNRHVDPSRLI